MKKTTIYLPDKLKEQVEEVAKREGKSEADVIRNALFEAVEREKPEPHVPLEGFSLGDPTIAERAGDLMDGFGR
jgi:metal-responsive CopG/Arc/MetJ family transcriptional regulator